MNFKPTKPKVILSILAVILWSAYVCYADRATIPICIDTMCSIKWGMYSPLTACACMPFKQLLQIYLVLLFPGILVYLVESFREARK